MTREPFGGRPKPQPPTRLLIPCLGTAIVLLGLGSSAAAREGKLELSAIDRDSGKPIAVRVHLTNVATKRPVRPAGVPLLGDHFVFYDKIAFTLPLGSYQFVMERGPEYLVRTGHFTINNYSDDRKTVDMKRFVNMASEGWYAGDLEVHRRERDIEQLMQAEDLFVAMLVAPPNSRAVVNDAAAQQRKTAKPPNPAFIPLAGPRFFSTSARQYGQGGNALLLLNLPDRVTQSSAAHQQPAVEIAAAARQAGAWIDATRPFAVDLPLLVAANKLDGLQIAHPHFRRNGVTAHEAGGRPRDLTFYPGVQGNGRWSMDIYYHLLNCGLRLPPSAGSGSGWTPAKATSGVATRKDEVTANLNPPGYNRVYVFVDGELTWQKWWDGLRAGRSMVTNGPLIRPSVEGQAPGYVFKADAGQTVELEVGLSLSTRDKISYLEIVKNGVTEHSVRLAQWKETGGRMPTVKFDKSGWFLVRAVCDEPTTYRFAATAPYYVEIGYQPRISRKSAEFFVAWCQEQLDRTAAATVDRSQAEETRNEMSAYWQSALSYWEGVMNRANSD